MNDSLSTPWYRRIGPGLIIACVVIGPGSVLTSSKVGAAHGYHLVWVVLVAVLLMAVYTTLGAKLGVATDRSIGDLITQRAGRPLAVVIGLGVFFISAAFQFGNNLGLHAALDSYVKFDYTIVLFNAMSIAFLFAFRNLYLAIERLMMALVALMLIAFALNLGFAAPNPLEFLRGMIPRQQDLIGLKNLEDFTVLALVGTTFVISAAFYQAYLVRQKGWSAKQLKSGLLDARIGAALMATITLMIMCTSAAVLRGKELKSVADVAAQLKPLFGETGHALFCLGLFAAAFSSFLVNSMIGGFILSDALGLGSSPGERAPKVFTTAVLLTGMSVALFVIRADWDPVPAVVAAQAVTVLAAPLMAGALWWLTSLRDVMGTHRNSLLMNVAAGIGFAMLLVLAAYVATQKVWPNVQEWIG